MEQEYAIKIAVGYKKYNIRLQLGGKSHSKDPAHNTNTQIHIHTQHACMHVHTRTHLTHKAAAASSLLTPQWALQQILANYLLRYKIAGVPTACQPEEGTCSAAQCWRGRRLNETQQTQANPKSHNCQYYSQCLYIFIQLPFTCS